MIWTDQDSESARASDLIRLANHVESLCVGAPVSRQRVRHVAAAVAAYWYSLPGRDQLPSSFVAALVVRALRGAGEPEAARIVGERESAGDDASALESMTCVADLSPAVWNLFASGVVRASRWISGAGRVVWVLDLERFRAGADRGLELYWMPGLQLLMRCLSGLWDASGGDGVLGLRLGEEGLRRGRRRQGLDVPGYCRDVLERIRGERGWSRSPQVVLLEALASAP